mmetsp:Transcript_422/g.1352  ORF Transcript_422/g.1352 Transcript_422/m.1352 type:complete len:80 (+) Transcript_422:2108-2347(+)
MTAPGGTRCSDLGRSEGAAILRIVGMGSSRRMPRCTGEILLEAQEIKCCRHLDGGSLWIFVRFYMWLRMTATQTSGGGG